MKRVLITAFGPYDVWEQNSGWLAVVELTRELPEGLAVTTRRYPVDFDAVKKQLAQDLQGGFDVALHLGQAPGSSQVRLEAIGLNIGGSSTQLPEEYQPLSPDGPLAYRSTLPLARWAGLLRAAGIPAQVSFHAGTYLCNATLYWSHYLAEVHHLATQSAFVHLPLDVSQVIAGPRDMPSLPAATAARAIRTLLTDLLQQDPT
jgi:pyroglutamyl-peptidase